MITGEKACVIAGQRYVLRFTWRAIAEVEGKYGDSPNLFKPEILASVAAAGFKDRHPEMTPERIMDLSPPLILFARDVQEALQWAYFGNEAVPRAESDDVKKNRLRAGLSRLFRRLWRLG